MHDSYVLAESSLHQRNEFELQELLVCSADLRPANIKAPLDVRAQVTEYICNSTSALVELLGVSVPNMELMD